MNIGVIFDCDGTLLDSMHAWRDLESSLAARGGFTLTKEDTDAMTTFSIPECGAYMHEKFGLGTSGEDVERMIDDFMMEFYSVRAQAKPGALAFVQQLADRGVPMGVASSTPKAPLVAGIEHCGFAPYMRTILSVDDVGASKREPVIYDAVRAALGTAREQTWGFEDALYAVRTLKRAGYHAWAMYDSDLSGTYEDLAAEADAVSLSFSSLSGDEFLSFACQ